MFSFVGDTVVDPFCGTGTTALAAVATGRHSISVDIDPGYIDATARRLRDSDVVGKVIVHRGRPTDDPSLETAETA